MTSTPARLHTEPLQRRVLVVLSVGQILGGVGMGAAFALGALLTVDVGGTEAVAGLSSTLVTFGAAGFAIPLARMARGLGRRRALATGAAIAAGGAALVIVAGVVRSFPLLLIGFGMIGAAAAANLQTRFAAVDLADTRHRGRDLSLVIWATTIGVVLGPNLATPGDELGRAIGLPPLTGAFALAVACQLLAAVLYIVALRPDPLLEAERRAGIAHEAASGAPAPVAHRRNPLVVLAHNPRALIAVITLALGHATMVGVMAITPVHLEMHGATIAIIGLTISLHTAGMYALSPIFGWLSDRVGRAVVILFGQAVFVAALVANLVAGADQVLIAIALTLLGIGWSASTIAASALLAESVPVAERTGVQGLSDTIMSLCGAIGGALAGPVLAAIGYGLLNAVTLSLIAVVVACVVALLATSARSRSDRAGSAAEVQ